MRCELRVTSGSFTGRRMWLRDGQTVQVGRTEYADLCISDDPLMSRVHFALDSDSGMLRIRDLGSRNGTYVNGQLVKIQELNHGDMIVAGQTRFDIVVDRVEGEGSSMNAPGQAGAPGQASVSGNEYNAYGQPGQAGAGPSGSFTGAGYNNPAQGGGYPGPPNQSVSGQEGGYPPGAGSPQAPNQYGAPQQGAPQGTYPPGGNPYAGGAPPAAGSPGGSVPPGSLPPGSMPGGAMPGGAMPPGAGTPGAGTPGAGTPGAGTPGAMPPGSMPAGGQPPGSMPPAGGNPYANQGGPNQSVSGQPPLGVPPQNAGDPNQSWTPVDGQSPIDPGEVTMPGFLGDAGPPQARTPFDSISDDPNNPADGQSPIAGSPISMDGANPPAQPPGAGGPISSTPYTPPAGGGGVPPGAQTFYDPNAGAAADDGMATIAGDSDYQAGIQKGSGFVEPDSQLISDPQSLLNENRDVPQDPPASSDQGGVPLVEAEFTPDQPEPPAEDDPPEMPGGQGGSQRPFDQGGVAQNDVAEDGSIDVPASPRDSASDSAAPVREVGESTAYETMIFDSSLDESTMAYATFSSVFANVAYVESETTAGLPCYQNHGEKSSAPDIAKSLVERNQVYLFVNLSRIDAESRSLLESNPNHPMYTRVSGDLVLICKSDPVDMTALIRANWGRDAIVVMISGLLKAKVVTRMHNHVGAYSFPSVLHAELESTPVGNARSLFQEFESLMVERPGGVGWTIFLSPDFEGDWMSLGLPCPPTTHGVNESARGDSARPPEADRE